MKYAQAFDGDWIRPVRRGYRMLCCDCGAAHRLSFRLTGKHIEFRPTRDNRATAAARRGKRYRRVAKALA